MTMASVVPITTGARAAEVPLPKVSFSGTLHMREEGRPALAIPLAHTPARLRYEVLLRTGKLFVLLDRPSRRAWVRRQATGRWRPVKWSPRLDLLRQFVPNRIESEKIATETVAGQTAGKFRFTGRDPRGRILSGHIWVTADYLVLKLSAVVRAGSQGRRIEAEIRDLKIGTADGPVIPLPPAPKK